MATAASRAGQPDASGALAMSFMRAERERTALLGKIRDLKLESLNHKLILEAFESVPADRRCYRMVGKVLVERNVGEVKPAILSHKCKVDEVLQNLEKELELLRKEQETLESRMSELGIAGSPKQE